MPATVQPETILKDLAKLWVDLNKEDSKAGSGGVIRACAMTLIVAAGEEHDPQNFSETISQVMHEHPGRVIVLRTGQVSGSSLESRVFAQCWKPVGRPQQICCEEVEITACPSRFADVPQLILGLTVPDLPVVLWLRASRPGGYADEKLFALADKIIVDSSRFNDPEEGLAYVREFPRKNMNAADLEWTRLTPWRESVAHIFEDERNLRFLKSIRQIRISHSGLNPPVSARYLASWFRRTLPSSVELSFQEAAGQPASRIRGIAMDGPDFSASIALEGSTAVLTINQLTRRTAFPACDDCSLLREELSILGKDPIFLSCLE